MIVDIVDICWFKKSGAMMAIPTLCPGGPYYGSFVTPVIPTIVAETDSFTVAPVAFRNGAIDTSLALYASQLSQGCWSVTGTIPASWLPGDTLAVFVTLTDLTVAPHVVIPILVDVVSISNPDDSATVSFVAGFGRSISAMLKTFTSNF